MNDNPYSPLADLPVEDPAPQEPQSVFELARGIFLAWEKLRVVYIVLLAGVCWLIGKITTTITSPEFWIEVFLGGGVANVCYFAGPILESYVTWLGVRPRWLRSVTFIAGTLFTAALAVVHLNFV